MIHLRIITKATSLPKLQHDNDFYAQGLELDCGHYFYHTFNNQLNKKHKGQQVICHICKIKPDHSEQL